MSSDQSLRKALDALELIQTHPGISGPTLAERLDTTSRAVRRTVASLREAGFDISSLPGPGGGYRLDHGRRIPLVFSSEELTALAMSLVESAGTVSHSAMRTASAKVLHAAPSRASAPARSVISTATAVTKKDGGVGADPSIVWKLARAVEQQLLIRIDYRAGGQLDAQERTVEPWSLMVRHRRWYLFCRDRDRAALRTFRVDRIETVAPMTERFSLPQDLNLAEEFEAHLRASWTHPTHVRLHCAAVEASALLPSTMGLVSDDGPGMSVLIGRTNNCEAYLTDLLSSGQEFTVIGGDELLAAAQRLRSRMRVEPG